MELNFHIMLFGIMMMAAITLLPVKRKFTIGYETAGALIPSFLDNLLFFASDEKTEEPTPKKLSESRKKGQVVKSQDLNSAIILLVCTLLVAASGDYGFQQIYKFLYVSLDHYINYQLTESNLMNVFIFFMVETLKLVGIIFSVVMAAGIVSNIAQSGFVFSFEPLKPNFKKLNPIEGFKNLFSKRATFNFIKTFLKFLLVGYTSYLFVKKNVILILSVTGVGMQAIFPLVKSIVLKLLTQIVFIMLALGILDFIFQKYDYKKGLKMTKQEVKEEYKQMEGDPQIRSARRQKQRQISMNRMMSEVSKSTVIITNPTHLAIALRYEHNVDDVPILVAKGADYVAGKIRELAKENNIPIIENKPLAQVLYKKVEIGQDVPSVFYQAVAEILAVVMRMKKKVI